jgi:phosphatidylinositol alpha-1,6-mannosyltransferase
MAFDSFAPATTMRWIRQARFLNITRYRFSGSHDRGLLGDAEYRPNEGLAPQAAAAGSDRGDWLALVTDAFGGRGGIAQYNRDFLSALANGRRIEVLPRHQPDEIDALPANVIQHRARLGRFAFAVAALRLALSQRPRFIFCGHLYMLPLGALLARVIGARLIVQVHGIEAWQAPAMLVRACVGETTLWLAVSRHTRRRLLAWSNIEPARVRVLPNTLSKAYERAEKPQHLIERYALHGKRVILTVGRLASSERYKGHDRVIAALPEVLSHCAEVVYLIVGSGDDATRLEARARQLGVDKRVIFAGQARAAELADYFSLADVFAMPSTGEGFGIVFLEAARSNVPVVGGDRDGSVDALADGAIGQLVDPDNQQQLVDAIMAALERRTSVDPRSVQRFAFENFSGRVDDLVRSIT